MKKKIIILLVLILIMIPLISGCATRGGGWIMVSDEPGENEGTDLKSGKANFGFTAELYETEAGELESKGSFLYNDHLNKVRIKGSILGLIYDDGEMHFGGDYTVGEEVGQYMVIVTDMGEPGDMDTFYIEVISGVYEGYMNEGLVMGGNIQIFEPEPN